MSQDLVFLIHPDGAGNWSIIDRETGRRLHGGSFEATEAPVLPGQTSI